MSSTKIESLRLRWCKAEEIEKLTVCEITVPESLDAFGYPVKNGMYDLRMGPTTMKERCETCKQNFIKCSGHFGYINFPIPVINPIFGGLLSVVINSMCHGCNKFKCGKSAKTEILKTILCARTNEICDTEGIEELTEIFEGRANEEQPNFSKHNIVVEFMRNLGHKRTCPLCEVKNDKYRKVTGCIRFENITTHTIVSNEYLHEKIHILGHNEPLLVREFFMLHGKEYGLAEMIFIQRLFVSPNKFRMPLRIDGETYEHSINTRLSTILRCTTDLMQRKEGSAEKSVNTEEMVEAELQNQVMLHIEGGTTGYGMQTGIKQILEKKEGLFRSNIMGKRVNFGARSVISPDPYISTDEIGIPEIFAMKLTFPERVQVTNVRRLRHYVENGPGRYPGANFLTVKNSLVNLEYITAKKCAEYLSMYETEPVIVHRHMEDGDLVLVNRQPTLHSSSLMAHRAKVLENEKTLRLHYVNCKPYNADFDGDEMNIHFPQDELSKAEASTIASVRNNFIVQSTGAPIRGLTQDHIVASSIISMKDCILSYDEYTKIVCDALSTILRHRRLEVVQPAIVMRDGNHLYTGKQVVTTILKNLKVYLNISIKGKLLQNENCLFVNSCFVTGLLDKNTLGTSSGSIPHVAGQIYGMEICDTILTALGRMINSFLLFTGFSIRFDDILVQSQGNFIRHSIFKEGSESHTSEMMSKVSTILKDGNHTLLHKDLLTNNFYVTIQSGAKGSLVNLSQISICLGQQEIEGQKVPVTVTGKTLPVYKVDEHLLNPAASGFVFERFLTGLNLPTMYFHCMAGREGLVDTAVKTANSGYLQRSLIKHLEGVKVCYDGTVRNSNGTIVQFSSADSAFYGRCVGIYAAQSIGEPSTQMTLNTFHLAGVAGRNVTLGIPRLREIIMFASKNIGTPQIVINASLGLSSLFTRTYLLECVEKISILNTVDSSDLRKISRIFQIKIQLRYLNPKIIYLLRKKLIKEVTKVLHKNVKSVELIRCIKEVGTRIVDKDSESSDESSKNEDEAFMCNEVLTDDEFSKSQSQDQDIELNQEQEDDDDDDESRKTDEDYSNRELIKKDFVIDGNSCTIKLKLPPSFNYFLLPIVRKTMEKIVVQEIYGFSYGMEDESGNTVLSGNNFNSLFDVLMQNHVPQHIFYTLSSTNDVWAAISYFGIEAGREIIVNEIYHVFNVYGISVLSKHIELVADFMTRNGCFDSFHRKSFSYESIFQMMSYESCYTFIKSSAIFQMSDNMKNPSASITVGNTVDVGTGSVQVRFDLNKL